MSATLSIASKTPDVFSDVIEESQIKNYAKKMEKFYLGEGDQPQEVRAYRAAKFLLEERKSHFELSDYEYNWLFVEWIPSAIANYNVVCLDSKDKNDQGIYRVYSHYFFIDESTILERVYYVYMRMVSVLMNNGFHFVPNKFCDQIRKFSKV